MGKHNDLVLRCSTGAAAPSQPRAAQAVTSSIPSGLGQLAEPTWCVAAAVQEDVGDLHREVELLRGENEKLRTRNQLLELGSTSVQNSPVLRMPSPPGVSMEEPVVPHFPAGVL